MQIEAEQSFTLEFPGTPQEALAFLRDPARSLAGVRFLQGLNVSGPEVRAVLLVNVPMLGETLLPLHSRVVDTPHGAALEARPITGERAWLELNGEATAEGHLLRYAFVFTAHIEMPSAEKWGGAAFEKMVRAAAERTLSRLARELPEGIERAMPQPG
ncbi:DUF3809 domain-containing protein [Deinococcus altitudinis]|uniref:DUF3809 domain-containing protein n=1 Tax=Deinococcus altitudinis TaxID=468914 RepID=UPI003892A608